MRSVRTVAFRRRFAALPPAVKVMARDAYRRWRADPFHPGLHFKKLQGTASTYSVRIGLGWRALGLLQGGTITWFWIGSHADYDQLIG